MRARVVATHLTVKKYKYKYSTGIRGIIILVLHSSKNINYTNTRAILYGINVRYKCMQVLTYIQVLFNATTTAKYAI